MLQLLNNKIQHLRKALTKYKYPKLASDKVERKFIKNNQENSNVVNNQGELSEQDSSNPSSNITGRYFTKEKSKKGHIFIPYTQGIGESIKRYVRNMASRPTSTEIEP